MADLNLMNKRKKTNKLKTFIDTCIHVPYIRFFLFVFFSRVTNIARRGKLCNVFYALKSLLTITYWIFCVLHILRCKSDREKKNKIVPKNTGFRVC